MMKIILFVAELCLFYKTLAFDFDKLNLSERQSVVKFHHPDYFFEEYSVTTSDGYILKLFRIPGSLQSPQKDGKQVVFLMHGLLCSSMDWLVLGKDKALAYLLVDAGFDVFLGNARGNTFSRRHHYLSPKTPQFWKFSWQEIGLFDLPAMIDFALSITKQRDLHYIGHSQGTTSFFALASLRVNFNVKIRSMHALAPVTYMSHLKSPLLRAMAPFVNQIEWTMKTMGVREFLPSHDLMVKGGLHICKEKSPVRELCANVLFLLCGYDSEQLNRTLLPEIFVNTPAGASVDQLVHYAQGINSGKFRMFDYGTIKNIFKYGSINPPSYNISAITTAVYIYYGNNDWMTDVKDVLQLSRELRNLIEIYRIPMDKFNHLDFTYASDADKLLYGKIIENIGK